MDKAPDFGLPFFYRVVVPGALVTVAAFPMLSAVLSTFGVLGKDQTPYLVGIAVFLGFLLSLMDDPIYQLIEGRTGWPGWFARWRERRWKRLVEQTFKRQAELDENSPERAECWYLLRQFPTDVDGKPIVKRPSRIGNAIAAYEDYAYTRYGMDDTFYWPRLWLSIDKDTRSEVDLPWAAVDACLYSAVGIATIAFIYLMLVVISAATAIFGPARPIEDPWAWLLCGLAVVVLLTLTLLGLRAAVPGIVANGERYKSVFDLYRDKLKMQLPTEAERAKWDSMASELQYPKDD